MKLKELMREVVHGEMDAISIYEEEAEVFASHPKYGTEISTLFGRLALEKRERLKALGSILRQPTGFRERDTKAARSIEASLRAHVTAEEICVANFAELVKQLNKPEFKETIAAMLSGSRAHLAAIRGLQNLIKGVPTK